MTELKSTIGIIYKLWHKN